MQVWTQRMADNTNREMVELRKHQLLIEKITNKLHQEWKHRNAHDNDCEINASDIENQENEVLHNLFRPSEINELRTPIQPIGFQNIDLDDIVIVNEDRTGEDYHMDHVQEIS